MTVEIPERLEGALKAHAQIRGLSAEGYVRDMLERDLGVTDGPPTVPFKTSRGMLAHLGPAPSAEEIDENRKEMFRGFGENF